MYKIKVAMVGPQRVRCHMSQATYAKTEELSRFPFQAGKTVLANFLSDAVENPVAESYRPTHVVRVLEFESSQLNLGNRYAKVSQFQRATV